MNLNRPFFVIACTAEESAWASQVLGGVVACEVKGPSDNAARPGFIIIPPIVPGESQEDFARSLGEGFRQQNVIGVDAKKQAYELDVTTGTTTELGTWREVSEAEALAGTGYTKANGAYFVAGGV